MALLQTRPLSLNSIHCNPARPWQFAVAGGDAYVRVYDRRMAAAVTSAAQPAAEAAGDDYTAQQNRNYAAALATPVSFLPTIHVATLPHPPTCGLRYSHESGMLPPLCYLPNIQA